METWMKIHGFITNNEVVMVILTYLIAEIIKRLIPTKSKESLMEMAGKVLRFILDKTHFPNKVKTVNAAGDKVIVEANPQNPPKTVVVEEKK